jgi:hypothetical protein
MADLYDVSLDYLLGRSETRSSFSKFQSDIRAVGGPIPLDKIFDLNDMDKELLRMLLVSLSMKPEYTKSPKAKGKSRSKVP